MPITKRSKKKASGQIVEIDGEDIDLKSNRLYANTGIDRLILYQALTTEDNSSGWVKYRTDTKQGFVISCFARTKLFKELLNRKDNTVRKKYPTNALEVVDTFAVRRLSSLVNDRLKKFEDEGLIETKRVYLCKPFHEIDADDEEVMAAEKKALRDVGCMNEYQACSNATKRTEFLQKRNEYIEKATGYEVVAKKFFISPRISSSEIKKYAVSNYEAQEILTNFMDIFREKLCFNIQEILSGKSSSKDPQVSAFDGGWIAIKIIQEYCAYMTNPIHKEDAQAFYSIEELEKWHNENDKSYDKNRTVVSSTFWDMDEKELRETIDIYAISNHIEEEKEGQRKQRNPVDETDDFSY